MPSYAYRKSNNYGDWAYRVRGRCRGSGPRVFFSWGCRWCRSRLEVKHTITTWPAIPRLGIYPREIKHMPTPRLRDQCSKLPYSWQVQTGNNLSAQQVNGGCGGELQPVHTMGCYLWRRTNLPFTYTSYLLDLDLGQTQVSVSTAQPPGM